MSLPGYVLSSSSGYTGGEKRTRFGGPVMVGQVADNGSSGPLPAPGAVICVQSTASLVNQIISTAAPSRGSYVYIPITTGPLNQSTAAPPYSGVGTPLIWDDTNFRLHIWSSSKGTWMTQLSSVGGGYWTTS